MSAFYLTELPTYPNLCCHSIRINTEQHPLRKDRICDRTTNRAENHTQISNLVTTCNVFDVTTVPKIPW